jgi:hypothetical protein
MRYRKLELKIKIEAAVQKRKETEGNNEWVNIFD